MGFFDFLKFKHNETKEKTLFKSFFLSVDTVRKKDGNLKRGECEIEIFDDVFQIRQGSEILEYYIDSIYYFGIWEYKDNIYFKFRMRSLNEIKFCSQYFECGRIAAILKKKGIKIEED